MGAFNTFLTTFLTLFPDCSEDRAVWIYLHSAGDVELAVNIMEDAPEMLVPQSREWTPPSTVQDAQRIFFNRISPGSARGPPPSVPARTQVLRAPDIAMMPLPMVRRYASFESGSEEEYGEDDDSSYGSPEYSGFLHPSLTSPISSDSFEALHSNSDDVFEDRLFDNIQRFIYRGSSPWGGSYKAPLTSVEAFLRGIPPTIASHQRSRIEWVSPNQNPELLDAYKSVVNTQTTPNISVNALGVSSVAASSAFRSLLESEIKRVVERCPSGVRDLIAIQLAQISAQRPLVNFTWNSAAVVLLESVRAHLPPVICAQLAALPSAVSFSVLRVALVHFIDSPLAHTPFVWPPYRPAMVHDRLIGQLCSLQSSDELSQSNASHPMEVTQQNHISPQVKTLVTQSLGQPDNMQVATCLPYGAQLLGWVVLPLPVRVISDSRADARIEALHSICDAWWGSQATLALVQAHAHAVQRYLAAIGCLIGNIALEAGTARQLVLQRLGVNRPGGDFSVLSVLDTLDPLSVAAPGQYSWHKHLLAFSPLAMSGLYSVTAGQMQAVMALHMLKDSVRLLASLSHVCTERFLSRDSHRLFIGGALQVSSQLLSFGQVFALNRPHQCVISNISIPVYLDVSRPSVRQFNNRDTMTILSALSSSPGCFSFLPKDSALISDVLRGGDLSEQSAFSSAGSVGLQDDFKPSSGGIMSHPVPGMQLIEVDLSFSSGGPLTALVPSGRSRPVMFSPQPLYQLQCQAELTISPYELSARRSPLFIGRFLAPANLPFDLEANCVADNNASMLAFWGFCAISDGFESHSARVRFIQARARDIALVAASLSAERQSAGDLLGNADDPQLFSVWSRGTMNLLSVEEVIGKKISPQMTQFIDMGISPGLLVRSFRNPALGLECSLDQVMPELIQYQQWRADFRLYPYQAQSLKLLLRRELLLSPIADGWVPVPLWETNMIDQCSTGNVQLQSLGWVLQSASFSLSPLRLFSSLLADEMGLGKTIVTLALTSCTRSADILFSLVAASLSRIMHLGDCGLVFRTRDGKRPDLVRVPAESISRLALHLSVLQTAQAVTPLFVLSELLPNLLRLGYAAPYFEAWVQSLAVYCGMESMLPDSGILEFFSVQRDDTTAIPASWPSNVPCLTSRVNMATRDIFSMGLDTPSTHQATGGRTVYNRIREQFTAEFQGIQLCSSNVWTPLRIPGPQLFPIVLLSTTLPTAGTVPYASYYPSYVPLDHVLTQAIVREPKSKKKPTEAAEEALVTRAPKRELYDQYTVVSSATLVVTTATAVAEWKRQLALFVPGASVIEFKYKAFETLPPEAFSRVSFVVASHANLQRRKPPLFDRIVWRRVVHDEFHIALPYIAAQHHLFLSGTPGSQDLLERLIMATSCDKRIHDLYTVNGLSESATLAPMIARHIKLLSPQILPERAVQAHVVPLSPSQRVVHDFLAQCLSNALTSSTILSVLQRVASLFLVCSAPFLLQCSTVIAITSMSSVQTHNQITTHIIGPLTVQEAASRIFQRKHKFTDASIQQLKTRIVGMLSDCCSICLGDFDYEISPPILLGCSHLFCLNCLNEHHSISGVASCPLCREPESTVIQLAQPDPELFDQGEQQHMAPEADPRNLLETHQVPLNVIQAFLNLATEKTRITEIIDLALELSRSGQKVVIVSRFQQVVYHLVNAIQAHARAAMIVGGTARSRRERVLNEFSDQASDLHVLVATTRSIDSGVNLQAAHHIILCEPSASPTVERQVVERVHRIGQKDFVTVHRFVSQNSVESRILALWEQRGEDITASIRSSDWIENLVQLTTDRVRSGNDYYIAQREFIQNMTSEVEVDRVTKGAHKRGDSSQYSLRNVRFLLDFGMHDDISGENIQIDDPLSSDLG